ncbi:MAG: MG2 domain-containing protein [Bacteroidales bacterium]|nr:MG2 domain-containing protein [Bacteroidales bacterium]
MTSFAQTTDKKPEISPTGNPEEELYIVTDRDIYISGEDVFLKVYCMDRQTHKPSGLSKVAYVSLLDRTSTTVVRVKIWLDGQSGSGKFTIPDTLRTGNYIINACTHLMQNFSPEHFAARKISVINPILSIDHIEVRPQDRISADAVQKNDPVRDSRYEDNETATGMAVCSVQTDKTTYQPREKVGITVSTFSNDGKPAVSDIVISVTRSFAHNGTNRGMPAGSVNTPGHGEYDPDVTLIENDIYLPEPEGHLVTGAVYSTVTGKPVTNEPMVLSVVGKTALCRFCKTDGKGAFYFVVNESGRQEIIIQPLNPELKDLYVELNDPFPEGVLQYDPGVYIIDTTMLKRNKRRCCKYSGTGSL